MNKTQPNKHGQQYFNRVDEIVILLLERQTLTEEKKTKDFLLVIMEKYSISRRMAESYLKSAFDEVGTLGKEKTNIAFEKAMRDREFLFRKAKERNDLRLALEVVKDRDRIAGLYIENIRVNTTPPPDFSNISTEKLMEILHNA